MQETAPSVAVCPPADKKARMEKTSELSLKVGPDTKVDTQSKADHGNFTGVDFFPILAFPLNILVL